MYPQTAHGEPLERNRVRVTRFGAEPPTAQRQAGPLHCAARASDVPTVRGAHGDGSWGAERSSGQGMVPATLPRVPEGLYKCRYCTAPPFFPLHHRPTERLGCFLRTCEYDPLNATSHAYPGDAERSVPCVLRDASFMPRVLLFPTARGPPTHTGAPAPAEAALRHFLWHSCKSGAPVCVRDKGVNPNAPAFLLFVLLMSSVSWSNYKQSFTSWR